MSAAKPKINPAIGAAQRATAGYELNGEKLQSFSGLRQNAASRMGLRFGLVDEKDIFTVTVETLKKKKKVKTDMQFYNQMFGDIVTVLWLCSVPTSRVLRAIRKVDEAIEDAFRWADDKGITLTSETYYQASAVFFQMMQDVAVSTGVPKPPEGSTGETDEDDDDPNE
jgi:hypothetical protein